MRLYGVEIKVSLAGDQVAEALEKLGIDPATDPEERKVGFIEDVTPGSDLPLFRAGIVLRVRKVPDDPDNSTVKLRPGLDSRLSDEWFDAGPDKEPTLKIEEDWAGDKHLLAVSHDSDVPNGLIDDVATGHEDVGRLFNESQEQFLKDCASFEDDLNGLKLLPLIETSRWKDVAVDGSPLELCVERWTIGNDLDFLELSTRPALAGEARATQRELDRVVTRLDLKRDDAESKTERVLTYLVASVRKE
jgi:hypothetical protein